jgi:hypothetical protein
MTWLPVSLKVEQKQVLILGGATVMERDRQGECSECGVSATGSGKREMRVCPVFRDAAHRFIYRNRRQIP